MSTDRTHILLYGSKIYLFCKIVKNSYIKSTVVMFSQSVVLHSDRLYPYTKDYCVLLYF